MYASLLKTRLLTECLLQILLHTPYPNYPDFILSRFPSLLQKQYMCISDTPLTTVLALGQSSTFKLACTFKQIIGICQTCQNKQTT